MALMDNSKGHLDLQKEQWTNLCNRSQAALGNSEKMDMVDEEMRKFLSTAWSSADTFRLATDVLDMYIFSNNLCELMDDFIQKLISLAQTKREAFSLLRYERILRTYKIEWEVYWSKSWPDNELKIIKRFLDLCEYSEEVDCVMDEICKTRGVTTQLVLGILHTMATYAQKLPNRPTRC
ncbi:MAG: hypothetical protein EOM84_04670 [Sphingobacteriia bacterium]|nr:hypothetical protein [Sphingobacteriia bacterium]